MKQVTSPRRLIRVSGDRHLHVIGSHRSLAKRGGTVIEGDSVTLAALGLTVATVSDAY